MHTTVLRIAVPAVQLDARLVYVCVCAVADALGGCRPGLATACTKERPSTFIKQPAAGASCALNHIVRAKSQVMKTRSKAF